MKKLIIIVTVFLLIAGVISTALATTAGAKEEEGYATKTYSVKLDGTPLFVYTSDPDTADIVKGERIYAEYDLVDPQDNVIGHYIYDAVRTTNPGEPTGWYASEHFHIDSLGAIETVGHGPPWQGAIVGGTGVFVGASGEWYGEWDSGDGYCTFIFVKPVKLPQLEE